MFVSIWVAAVFVSVAHLGGKAWLSKTLLKHRWPHGKVARQVGVRRSDGTPERALFIIDKTDIICFISVSDINRRPLLKQLADALKAIHPPSEQCVPSSLSCETPVSHNRHKAHVANHTYGEQQTGWCVGSVDQITLVCLETDHPVEAKKMD